MEIQMPKCSNTHVDDVEVQKEIIRAVTQLAANSPNHWSVEAKAQYIEKMIAAFYDGLDSALNKYTEPFDR